MTGPPHFSEENQGFPDPTNVRKVAFPAVDEVMVLPI
jgi:hypothetical protein